MGNHLPTIICSGPTKTLIKAIAKFTNNGNFRGHLLTCWARYNFSKQLKGNLVGEYLMPGNYYSQTNR